MVETDYAIKASVSWLPAGLVSWYAPDGIPVALVTSWVALIGGEFPRIKTAWYGRYHPLSRLWTGGDFIFNVPSESGLKAVRDLIRQGQICLNAEADLRQTCARGDSVWAPRLTGCAVQLECVGGTLADSGYDTELSGDVVRMHRGTVTVAATEVKDLCAMQPLSPLLCE